MKLNKKIILLFFLIIIVSIAPTISFGQLTIGSPAAQRNVEVTISEEGDVQVIHEIGRTSTVRSLETIPGNVSNLTVIDEDGNEKEFGVSEYEDSTTVTIFPVRDNVFVKYDLEPDLALQDGVWTWNFLYRQSTTFKFPERADLVFINQNPITVEDNSKIRCHGCQMKLEYALDEPTKFFDVEYEEGKFQVEIRTFSDISKIIFNQPSKRISFDVEKEKFVTLTIPLKLLWNPYTVALDEQKILKHEFEQNETHIKLNFKPSESGRIDIIGTSVIPEFPLFIPLVIGIVMIIGLQFKSRIILR
jgi:hypothetical protein